jgi:hypothetical protein
VDPLRRRKVRNVPFDDIADWFAADDPMPDFVVADVVRMADRLPSARRGACDGGGRVLEP